MINMTLWSRFKKNRLGLISLCVFLLFFLLAVYAPFFASSKPLVVYYDGSFYFPLFRYLFYKGFFSKPIDLFYNVLMFTFPIAILGLFLKKKSIWIGAIALQFLLFVSFNFGIVKDPERKTKKSPVEQESDLLSLPSTPLATWKEEEQALSPYAKLNTLLKYRGHKEKLEPSEMTQETYQSKLVEFSSLVEKYKPLALELKLSKLKDEEAAILEQEVQELERKLASTKAIIRSHRELTAKYEMVKDRQIWLEKNSQKVKVLLTPFFRPFHWEDDAGGSQLLNKTLPWWELTRINRKDLTAALLFGIRISLVVAVATVSLSLALGIPVGLIAGYFAGKVDMIICRLIEIWEAIPLFFMLLLIVAITQTKSIFLVILVLALFSWTHFARYVRAEVLRQRSLAYVLSLKSQGFDSAHIMFSNILPNSLFPVLTLLPFSMMAAIVSEAGLSFLGLGEEGSTSLGVLMAEGRSVFPGESYLLWPPAIILTILLVAIALAGDALRDATDPKMRS